ncbi:MAG: hypothetical protein JO048_17595 [Methylobacteriaceae bacterium]|nr:hypothetical protein [Methylobacteriaceae bacterium]
MAELISSDFAQLEKFAAANHRVGYWFFLANKGDKYAELSLGLATNETSAGYVANQFCLKKAERVGVSFTESELYQKIGVGLMEADLDARKTLFEQGAVDGGLV